MTFEYYSTLSDEAKEQYESKVAKIGLKINPYKIDSSLDIIPDIDMMIYMMKLQVPMLEKELRCVPMDSKWLVVYKPVP